MSDEQKRIEELEQQLKIAKLEKELAEMKAEKAEVKNKANEQEIQNNFTKEEIIENYINEKVLKTDCIVVGNSLTNEIIVQSGMQISNDEKPLLLLYKKSLFYDLKTRILITNKHIYFKALPDTFWIGLTCNFAKKIEGKFELERIKNIEIAEQDHAFGTAYVGHQLKINNEVMGLVRMGANAEYDEETIKYLNNLFIELTGKNNSNYKTETETISNATKEKTPNAEVSDSWQTIAWKLGLAIIGAIMLSTIFPNMFSDKIVVTNPNTGEEIEFPVETTTINGEENYCINVSVLEGSERTFCSIDKEALTKFATKVKEQEVKMTTQMAFRGQSVSSEATQFYSLDDMIYAGPRNQYNIYERNPQVEQEEVKIKKAVEIYHKEHYKEMAKQYGVSEKCYADYQKTIELEGEVTDDNHPCSPEEQQSIKSYLTSLEKEYYIDDTPEPVYGNDGMPKSLVLQDVPIMCFEKANLGDNSKCTKKQLNTIKEYYRNNHEIDWEKEYFEY